MAKEKQKAESTTEKKKAAPTKQEEFAFGKYNYYLMFVGIAFIAIGFILMIGGGSDDPDVFSEEVFSFRRITLAPILILIGYIIEIFAIMKKNKAKA